MTILVLKRFEFGRADTQNRVGEVTGLAWTEVGGDLLTIETASVPGKGKLSYTGSLGDVMKESNPSSNDRSTLPCGKIRHQF